MLLMRGRNGRVEYRRHETYARQEATYVYIDLFSKKRGKYPPVFFEGDLDEVAKLFSRILSELFEIKANIK